MASPILLRRRGDTGVAWSPRQLPNTVAWWRADDIAGTDGTAVTSWADRVNGTAVTQATGSAQPVLKTAANGINSQPVVRFASASSQFLSTAIGTLPARGPYYAFAVYRQTTAITAKLISSGKTGSNVGMGFGFNASSLMMTTYGILDINGSYGSGGAGVAALGLWGHSGTASYFNRNNIYSLNTAAASNANVGADTFTIGGKSTASAEFYNGDVAEIVIMTSLPSATDRLQMAKYVTNRYGITPMGTPYNSPASVATPSADATGTCVETSVLYFPSGWNGFNYWCAFVPYGSNSVVNENPTILQSNDGNTWQTPTGAPVPVVAYPGGGNAGNNSDPGLFYNPGDGKLYLYYQRENTTPASTGGVWVTSSSDGVTWSAVSQVIAATANNSDFEPKVLYNSATSEWWLYTIDASGGATATALYRRVSTTGPTTGYGSRVACSVTIPGGRHMWHTGNVVKLAGKWVTAFSDDQSLRQVWLASSTDGLTWTLRQQPILIQGGVNGTTGMWEATASIYRLTLVDSGDGANAWGWYSTLSGSNMSQKVTIPFYEIP